MGNRVPMKMMKIVGFIPRPNPELSRGESRAIGGIGRNVEIIGSRLGRCPGNTPWRTRGAPPTRTARGQSPAPTRTQVCSRRAGLIEKAWGMPSGPPYASTLPSLRVPRETVLHPIPVFPKRVGGKVACPPNCELRPTQHRISNGMIASMRPERKPPETHTPRFRLVPAPTGLRLQSTGGSSRLPSS
jgi:hypothetical protein